MARLITGTIGSFLNVNTGTNVPLPFSYSCRFKVSHSGIVLTYGEFYGAAADAEYSGPNLGTPGSVGLSSGKSTGAGFTGTSVTMPVLPDTWYLMIAVCTSNSERRIYVNNSSLTNADFTFNGPPDHLSKNITIGGFLITPSTLYGGYEFNGEVADVAMWNMALSASDVDALATSRPNFVQQANLIAYWKLGEDGSLANSAGTWGPLVEIGTVPVTSDPPYNKAKLILEHSYRNYLGPSSRITYPLDDPLLRNLTASLPCTETYTQTITDLVSLRPFAVPPVTDTYFRWDTDGGLNASFSGYNIELEAPWSLPGVGYVVPTPPLTISLWAKSFYTSGIIYHMGEYAYQLGIKIGSSGPDNTVYIQRIASTANDLVSSIGSTTICRQDTWLHIVGTLSKDLTLRLYINGKLEAANQNSTPQATMSRARLFLSNTEGETFYGGVRDIRVWSTDLQASQVLDLYTRGYARNLVGTVPTKHSLLYFERALPPVSDVGAYAYTGYPVTFGKTRLLVPEAGSYLLGGLPVITRADLYLRGALGTYAYGAGAVALALIRLLQANPGGYILAGEAATLTLARGLLAEYGVYALEGMQAGLLYRVIHAGGGRIFYVMREDRTLRIIRDEDVRG